MGTLLQNQREGGIQLFFKVIPGTASDTPPQMKLFLFDFVFVWPEHPWHSLSLRPGIPLKVVQGKPKRKVHQVGRTHGTTPTRFR